MFGVGAMSCLASDEFGSDGYCYEQIDEMADSILGQIHEDVNLLVKGSRSAGMDKLVDRLITRDGRGDVNHAV
jgi:UDP-N-acetylmuramyl pentapeptide synthase